jgi:hypothetical protein
MLHLIFEMSDRVGLVVGVTNNDLLVTPTNKSLLVGTASNENSAS